MANKKISELTNINNPNLSAITPVVVNNITYKTSLQNLRQVLVDNGSHNFTGSQNINGDLVVSGSLTAQQYIISSSLINIITENISGSTSFGNTEDDTHVFTGSVFIEGNLNVTATGSMKNLIVGFGEFNQSNPEVLHVESSGSFNIADFKGDFASYAQLNFKNKNSGSVASGDVVITADNGTEEIHYVDLGINSSTYNAGYVGYENDAYLINAGKDLYLGTIGGIEEHPSKVHIFTNNSWDNSQIIISSNGDISFNTGSVTTGFTYEFSGSLKLQHELDVSGSVTASFFVGDGSQLTNLPSQSLDIYATTGSNLFYGDQRVIGNVESDFYVVTQYVSAPTSSQQIIITGDPNKDTLIGVYSGDDIELILFEVENSIWEFQRGGIMKFPNGTYQNTAFTTSSIAGFATTGSNTFVGNQIINGTISLDNGSVIKDTANQSISFGIEAAESGQGTQSTAVGSNAGQTDQGNGATALGALAGNLEQGQSAVAIGALAGSTQQGDWAIAIGAQAGGISQGNYSIALGNLAGGLNQAPNSIVINATGTQLDNTTTSSLKIAPIRINDDGNENVLVYNTSTKEVSYSSNKFATTGSNTFIGNQTINGSLIIQGVSEVLTVDGGFSGNRDFDYTSGSIFYITGLTGNGIWNVNNVPTDENKAITITFVVSQDSTPYSGSQYQINSSNVTVKWVDNSIPTGSSNNVDVIGLTAFRVGSSWNVLGGLSTFGI